MELQEKINERFNFVIEGLNEGLWDYDFATNDIYWSKTLFRILGIDSDSRAVTYDYFLSFVHPEDSEAVTTAFFGSIKNKTPFETEFRMRHVSGDYIYCHSRGRGYYDDSGNILRFAGLLSDISERKRNEKLIEEKNIQLDYLNKIGKTITAKLELNEIVQEVTDITTKLTGAEFGAFFYNVLDEKGEAYTLYTLSGVPLEAFSKFPMPRNTEVFAPTFHGEGTVISDDITKDPRYGKNKPYHGMPEGHLPVRSYLAVSVKSTSGEVLGGLFFGHSRPGVFKEGAEFYIDSIASQAAIAIDNARLFKEKEISENNFRMLAESIPQIVWTLNPSGRPEYFNKKWTDYTGLTLKDIKMRGMRLFLHPDDTERFYKKWSNSIKSGNNYEIEYRLRGADGSYRWHLARAISLKDDDGKIIRWFGTSTDIDEQKKLEEKKDEFLGIASHELKTPLTSIKAYIQLIERSIAGINEPRLNQYIHKATSNINKLSDIISDLLDVSKIQAGKLEFNFSELDFDELVKESVENIQYISKEHNLIIEGSTGAKTKGDRQRLEQVFTNLLSNAVKYSPGADKIIVRLSKDDKYVQASITDYGIGIAGMNLDRIFEKYYRIENTSMEFSGIGIGLYITAEIIQRHKGKIWVESREGEGSTFYFKIPLS